MKSCRLGFTERPPCCVCVCVCADLPPGSRLHHGFRTEGGIGLEVSFMLQTKSQRCHQRVKVFPHPGEQLTQQRLLWSIRLIIYFMMRATSCLSAGQKRKYCSFCSSVCSQSGANKQKAPEESAAETLPQVRCSDGHMKNSPVLLVCRPRLCFSSITEGSSC